MRAAVAVAFMAMVASTAHAQVIEIAPDGVLRRYDTPTRFEGERATPIRTTTPPAARYTAAATATGLDPALVEAVAWTESRGRDTAHSRKGAFGAMQLMPATAALLGVDARDPEANLLGGARYPRQMVDRFGDWPLALAAYNAGPNAVARAKGVPDFAETRAYVATVLARWSRATPAVLREAGAAEDSSPR